MNKPRRDKQKAYSSLTSALGKIAGPAVLIIVGIAMLSIGWRRWPDALIDFGRELYVPWQLSEGQVLYRDIAYFNGPVSPYFNALMFKLFGVGLMSLAWVNIAVLAGLTVLLYRLLCSVGSRVSATLGCAVLLTVFALGQLARIGNYNFVCPYSHEMTHGLILSVSAIYLLNCYFKKRWPIHLGLSGLCLGLVLLTKVEVFLAASSALGIGWILILWQEKPAARRLGRLFALFTAGFVIPLACFLVYFSLQMGPGQALRSMFAGCTALLDTSLTGQKFYQATMGLDKPGENLVAMLKVAGCYLLLIGPLLALEHMIRSRKSLQKFSRPVMFAVGLGLGLWLFRVDTWFDASRIRPRFAFDLLRPLPMFMLAIGIVLLITLCRRRNVAERHRLMIALVLTVYSTAF